MAGSLHPSSRSAPGFFWAAALRALRMADWLAPELEGRDIDVVGVVSSLPAPSERGVRFELDVESAPAASALPGKLLLSWYRTRDGRRTCRRCSRAAVHPGERWLVHRAAAPAARPRQSARLRLRGVAARARHRRDRLRAAARRAAAARARAIQFSICVERAREAVRDRFHAVLGATPAAGILAALAVGDQRAISREEWQLFNRTGVTHLMCISGPARDAGLGPRRVARRVALAARPVRWRCACRRARRPRLAAIVGALGYTLLAGFGVPAQRTFWMVTRGRAGALERAASPSPWRTLALALAAIVLLDPWAPLAPGFWLSFGAVLAHLLRRRRLDRAAAPNRAMGARAMGDHRRARAGGAAALRPGLGRRPARQRGRDPAGLGRRHAARAARGGRAGRRAARARARGSSQWLLQFLEWCAALPGALWQQHVPPLWAVLARARRRGVAARAARRAVARGGLALMAPAFCLAPPAPAPGEAWITTFDVGQGLAVLVRTASAHAALRRRPRVRRRGRQRRARRRAGAARRGRRAARPRGAQPRGQRPHRRRAQRARELRGATRSPRRSPRAHALHGLAPQPRRCAGGRSAGNGTACASSSCIRGRQRAPCSATT